MENPSRPPKVKIGPHTAYTNRPPIRYEFHPKGYHLYSWSLTYVLPNGDTIGRGLGRLAPEDVQEAMEKEIKKIKAEFAPNSYEHRYNLLKGLNRYYAPANQYRPPHSPLTNPQLTQPFKGGQPKRAIVEGPPDSSYSEAHTIASQIVPRLKKAGWDLNTQVVFEPPHLAYSNIAGCPKDECKGLADMDAILYAVPGFPLAILEAKAGINKMKRGGEELFQLREWKPGTIHEDKIEERTVYSLEYKSAGAKDTMHKLTQIMGYTAASRVPFFILADHAQAVFIDTTGLLPPEIITYNDTRSWIKTGGRNHSFFTPEYLIEKYKRWVKIAENVWDTPDPKPKEHLSVLYREGKLPYQKPSPQEKNKVVRVDGEQVIKLRAMFNSKNPEAEGFQTAKALSPIIQGGQVFFENPFKPMWERLEKFFAGEEYQTPRSLLDTPQKSIQSLIKKNTPYYSTPFPSPLQRHAYSEVDILVKHVYPTLSSKGWSFNLTSSSATNFAQAEPSYTLPEGAGVDTIRPDVVLFTTQPNFSFLAVIEAKAPYRAKRKSEPMLYNFTDQPISDKADGSLQRGAQALREVLRDSYALNAPLAYLTDGAGFFEIDRIGHRVWDQPMTMTWIPNSHFPTPEEMKKKIASTALMMSRIPAQEQYGFITQLTQREIPKHIQAFASNASLLGGALELGETPFAFVTALHKEVGADSDPDSATLLMHPDAHSTPYVVSPRMAIEVAWIVNKMLEKYNWDAPTAFSENRKLLKWLSNFLTDSELQGSSKSQFPVSPQNSIFLRKHADKLAFLSSICRTVDGMSADAANSVHLLPPYDKSHVEKMRTTINASNTPMFSSQRVAWNNLMDFGEKVKRGNSLIYKGTGSRHLTVAIDKMKQCVDGLAKKKR